VADLWNVWRVHYQTYAEVLTLGDKPPELIAKCLPYAQAKALVDEFGTNYCMKPA
jgi:hypothetical protein